MFNINIIVNLATFGKLGWINCYIIDIDMELLIVFIRGQTTLKYM